MHASVTVSISRFTLRLICLGWLLATVGLHPAVFAQSAATGRVVGRIFNPSTGEYVRNAEIRVQGTQNTVYSEEGGVYQLDNVLAGSATLEVAFSGYQTARAAVTVTAGAAVTRDFELVSTLPKPAGKDEVVLISKFVVTTEREGNAKAIMEQRRNMNISTSVAADSFGDGSEGNVGEFLKFLPGVDVEYVDGVSRGPRIGGLDQSYVGVTMDGASIASADAFVSYGATLNGSTGGQSRSVGFEQMSITAIESVEISRTSSADMDASSPAGTINMKTRRAFDRKGRRLDWQVSMSANSGAMTTRKGYGLDDVPRYVIRPNYQLDYSDVFLNQRLGIRLGVSKSSVLAQQQYVTHTYNRTPTTADPRPVVLTGITFADGPKLTDRSSVTFTSDFKATPRLVLSFTGMFNAFENSGHTYNLAWTASANGGAAATGRQNVLGNGLTEIRTNGLATNTSRGLTLGGGSAIKLTNTTTITPKFEFKLNALTVDGVFNFSRSKNDYETSSRGTIRVETANINNADFRATRSDPLSAEWTLVQTGGADWSNLASFTNPRTTEEGRFVVTEIYTGETNAKYVLPWRLPTSIKVGGKWAEERRISDNAVPYLVYSYNGPGGGPTGSFANYASPRKFNTDFGRINSLNVANVPTLVDRSALSVVFRERPEYFVNSATVENYYTATIANHRDFLQTVSAAYGMADTKIGKLQLRGGVRWERTETSSKEVDPYTAAEVQAAGYPISTTTRRATTIAGMNYQFLSRPRITRDGVYDNFFPSASLKYSLLPNLQAQFGYAHAISRPPIDALAGVWNINDVTLLITAPNPKLKPERSDNYVARLAYYFEPVGSFTVLVQQTEITDQRITVRGKAADFGFENDPEYAAYDFQSLDNNDSLYRYRSLELSYNQQLSFLPGLLRTTNLNLSYTRNYANQYFPGVTPHKVAGSLGWSIGRLSFRSGVVWQDDTPFTSVFGRFQRHNLKVDFGGSYRLSDRLSFFFQGRNVLNDPNLLYEGDPLRGQPAVLYRYGNFGVSWVAGVKGNF